MAPTLLPDELWDIDELAAFLGKKRRFVYRLTHERRIRFYKVGTELRFDPRDVAAFLANSAVHPPEASTARRRGRPRTQMVRP